MNSLPLHILHEILFRLQPKSLAMMRCTNNFLESYISDPNFESEYFSRFGSSLFYLRKDGSSWLYCHPMVSSCDSMSLANKSDKITDRCFIFGSCSGLLLLYIGGLFIANPLTKKFRLIDHFESKLLSNIVRVVGYDDPDYYLVDIMQISMCIGFAVDQNQTTKRFKIVGILEMETVYGFEISDGNSWRLSKTTIATSSKSDLMKGMNHVYLDGNLHWLRNDGSIIAFNPETEQGHLIPSLFHRERDMTLLFATDDKNIRLILISGTEEAISIYTLLENSNWTLARRIKNVSIEKGKLVPRNVVAYDGKHLVVWDKKSYSEITCVVRVYDMEANSWRVSGLTELLFRWILSIDFYKFTPSLFFVQDDEDNDKVLVASGDIRIINLRLIMGLIDTTK